MFSKLIKKISLRLTVGFAFLFIIGSLLILTLNYMLFQNSLTARDHDLLHSKIKEYASVYSKNNLNELIKYLDDEKKSDNETQFLVHILSKNDDTIFLHLPEKMQTFEIEEIKTNLLKIKKNNSISSFHMLNNATSDEVYENFEYETINFTLPDQNILQVARNTDDRDDLLERYNRIVLIGFGFVLMFGSISGYIFSNQALRPLRNLLQTIRLISFGDFKARVPVKNSHDEIDAISIHFNQMTDKIEQLILNMQQTLDHVAHDLKTPLTRMRSRAELALLKNKNDADYPSVLADVIENTSEIVSMLNTIMDISEAEAGVLKLNLTEINSSDILKEVIDLYSFIAEEKNIHLKFECHFNFKIYADKNRFKQVISNLLDNAIKYSTENTTVTVISKKNEFKNQIIIQDQGIGISEDNISKIWERLFRADEVRMQNGLGLGLNLVQSICKAHGWKIEVSSQLGLGSKFIITF